MFVAFIGALAAPPFSVKPYEAPETWTPFGFLPGNALVQWILAAVILGVIIQIGRLMMSRAGAHMNTKNERAAVSQEVAPRPPADLE
jgi:hypothetical protein